MGHRDFPGLMNLAAFARYSTQNYPDGTYDVYLGCRAEITLLEAWGETVPDFHFYPVPQLFVGYVQVRTREPTPLAAESDQEDSPDSFWDVADVDDEDISEDISEDDDAFSSSS